MRTRLFLLGQVLAAFFIALACCGCPEGGSGNSQGPAFRSYFVYTANTDSNDVSMFQANPEGKLEYLGKVAAGNSPTDVAFDSWVYVANSADNTISVFSLGQDGRLTLTATVPTGTTPVYLSAIKEPPDRNDRLYVSCAGSDEVIQYDIVRGTGNLAETHRFSVPGPGRATEGINLYIPSVSENRVYQFENTVSGWVAGTPAFQPTGDAPIEAYSSYLGDALYTVNFLGSSVSMFDIGLAGDNPKFLPNGSVNTGSNPIAIAADANSSPQNMYVVNKGIETISHYDVDSNGVLTPAGGSTPSAGTAPTDIVTANNGINDFHVYAYVTNSGGDLRLYKRESDGSLSFVESYDTHGSNVVAVAVSDFRNSVPLTITTDTLPDGTFGQPYSAELQVEGGTANKAAHFEVRSGQLPPGLHFDEAAPEEADRYTRLVGTPTQHGTFTFELAASQPGIGSNRKSFTVVIAPSGGGGDTAMFMNASPDGGNATFKIDNSLVVANNIVYPDMANPVSLGAKADGASHTLQFTNTTNSGTTGSSTLIAGNSYLFFGLGTHSEGNLAIGRRVLATGYAPPTGKILITLVDGLQAFPIDFYILTGTDTPNGTNKTATLSFGQTLKIQPELDAGSYRVFATSAGNPSDIIAQTSLFAFAAGKMVDYVLVSPPSVSATFVTVLEN